MGVERPVEKVQPRIVGVGIDVENINDGQVSGSQYEPALANPPGQLIRRGLDAFFFAAQIPGLAHEESGTIKGGGGPGGLLIFPIGQSSEPRELRQGNPLNDLRIEVKLRALPQPRPEKEGGAEGVAPFAQRNEAIGTRIRGVEGSASLPHVGCLKMRIEGLGLLPTFVCGFGWSKLLR